MKLFSGVLVGLLLPKIIGVTDYGYYKTYTLYIHYVGLLHFGISDGIYLIFGGKDYEQLNRDKFRFYSKFFIILEAVISVILFMVSLLFLSGENRFIFSCVAAYLFANNVAGYYQMISQITGRFQELSRRNVIQSAMVSISVIGLYFLQHCLQQKITYKPYTMIYTILIVLLAIWYMWTYREITFGKETEWKKSWREIITFIKSGFPLTIANLCATFILALDRQFVNILFDTDTYAIYAFAYNMLALVTTAVSAISTVLYPKLKRTDTYTLQKNYSKLVGSIACLVSIMLSVYFPLCGFVKCVLPEYTDSLLIFRVIFPGLLISSVIQIVMHNYYKALGLNHVFFLNSVMVLLISAVANYAAYKIWGTTLSISTASIIVMIFWYIKGDFYFAKKYGIRWKENALYILTIMLIFYLVTAISNVVVGCMAYLFVCGAITAVFLKKNIFADVD